MRNTKQHRKINGRHAAEARHASAKPSRYESLLTRPFNTGNNRERRS